VEADRGAVRSAIERFVEAYNGFVRTANELTRYDAETGNAGPLQGDISARSILDQVRRSVTDSVGGAGSLAELGITTGADGTLAIDDGRLSEALEADLPSIAALFSTEGTGVATRTDALLDGYLRSGGLFDTRTSGIQGRVDGIADDREALNRRLDALESRYRAQFNALDSLLAELQSTGDFVAQQLANIPLPGDRNN
jgi:flagellar hook-associated protein 2